MMVSLALLEKGFPITNMKYNAYTSPEWAHYQRMNVGIHIKSFSILLNSFNKWLKFGDNPSCCAFHSMDLICSTSIVQYCFWGSLKKDALRVLLSQFCLLKYNASNSMLSRNILRQLSTRYDT